MTVRGHMLRTLAVTAVRGTVVIVMALFALALGVETIVGLVHYRNSVTLFGGTK